MKPALGDTVWLAKFATNECKTVPCCVCFGIKRVTLILGNGEQVLLPCDYCGKGYDEPTGREIVYESEACSAAFVVAKIETRATLEGEEITYVSTSGEWSSNTRLFATKEEADACALELAREHEVDERTRTEAIKANIKKTFAWNAGYHMRQVKDCEKRAEYHRSRVILCRDRAKEKP